MGGIEKEFICYEIASYYHLLRELELKTSCSITEYELIEFYRGKIKDLENRLQEEIENER